MRVTPLNNRILYTFKGKTTTNDVGKQKGYTPKGKQFRFHSAKAKKVVLPHYIPAQLKENEVELVNVARTMIAKDYSSFCENDSDPKKSQIVLKRISSNVGPNNRIIPPPIDRYVIDTMRTRMPKASISSEEYNSLLIKNSLNEIQKNPKYDKVRVYDSDGNQIDKNGDSLVQSYDKLWVRIPSRKRDKVGFRNNVKLVEKLSNPNWCTRSRYDKAEAVLEDGNYYVLVCKDENNMWTSEVAMPTHRGLITQIQGKANDNTVPLEHFDTIVKFLMQREFITVNNGQIKNKNCVAGYTEEGPNAYTQLLIADFLSKKF